MKRPLTFTSLYFANFSQKFMQIVSFACNVKVYFLGKIFQNVFWKFYLACSVDCVKILSVCKMHSLRPLLRTSLHIHADLWKLDHFAYSLWILRSKASKLTITNALNLHCLHVSYNPFFLKRFRYSIFYHWSIFYYLLPPPQKLFIYFRTKCFMHCLL